MSKTKSKATVPATGPPEDDQPQEPVLFSCPRCGREFTSWKDICPSCYAILGWRRPWIHAAVFFFLCAGMLVLFLVTGISDDLLWLLVPGAALMLVAFAGVAAGMYRTRRLMNKAAALQEKLPQQPVPEPQVLEAQGAVGKCLIRTQELLLRAGYVYTDGDQRLWPMCAVNMEKAVLPGTAAIAVVPWEPQKATEIAERLRALRAGSASQCGMILVGSAERDSPEVREFVATTKGTIAYLDAERRRLAVKRPWSFFANVLSPMLKVNLRRFLSYADVNEASEAYCRDKLYPYLGHAEQKDLFQEFRLPPPVARPVITCALGLLFLGVFLAMAIDSGNVWLLTGDVLISWGALHVPRVRAGEWWRVLSCWVVHCGLCHALITVVLLGYYGSKLERFEGRFPLIAAALAGALAGSLVQVSQGGTAVYAGASCGAFGVIGACLVAGRRRGRYTDPLALGLSLPVLVLVALQGMGASPPIFGWPSHVSAAAAGAAVMPVVRSLRRGPETLPGARAKE